MASPNEPGLTVARHVAHLVSDPDAQVLAWPPDVFAVAASVLQRSGAYTVVGHQWPPRTADGAAWDTFVRRLGRAWRAAAGEAVEAVEAPPEVKAWWDAVASSTTHMAAVRGDHALCEALVQLLVAADEACAGAWVPYRSEKDAFGRMLVRHLGTGSTEASSLCRAVDPEVAQVLPKLHTPQSGLTLRSLSLHLAFADGVDVRPRWHVSGLRGARHGVNLLMVPWPPTVRPSAFAPAPVAHGCGELPSNFGFFRCEAATDDAAVAEHVARLLEQAEKEVGGADMVVLPEAAVGPHAFEALARLATAHQVVLVCGVAEAASNGPGRNLVRMVVPRGGGVEPVDIAQHKHHRWRLDRRQIVQYGLGARLDPTRQWWEHIQIPPRELAFVAMQPWLTVCALVCEDLARQDPVAELIRAVGPNLVVALLMDGPQLASRWPGRYATVLADDPGSSVLSVTSKGMAALSRPAGGSNRSDVVALWKDARTGESVEISLPNGADAVVLSLTREMVREWCADGRHDEEGTGYLSLSGTHALFSGVEKAAKLRTRSSPADRRKESPS